MYLLPLADKLVDGGKSSQYSWVPRHSAQPSSRRNFACTAARPARQRRNPSCAHASRGRKRTRGLSSSGSTGTREDQERRSARAPKEAFIGRFFAKRPSGGRADGGPSGRSSFLHIRPRCSTGPCHGGTAAAKNMSSRPLRRRLPQTAALRERAYYTTEYSTTRRHPSLKKKESTTKLHLSLHLRNFRVKQKNDSWKQKLRQPW